MHSNLGSNLSPRFPRQNYVTVDPRTMQKSQFDRDQELFWWSTVSADIHQHSSVPQVTLISLKKILLGFNRGSKLIDLGGRGGNPCVVNLKLQKDVNYPPALT